jgi:hypothetical protein
VSILAYYPLIIIIDYVYADLNSGRWKMNDDALQRRHALFWRLFVVDTWAVRDFFCSLDTRTKSHDYLSSQSTHLGRPSSILQSHIDIPLPPHPTVLSESGADAATMCTFLS